MRCSMTRSSRCSVAALGGGCAVAGAAATTSSDATETSVDAAIRDHRAESLRVDMAVRIAGATWRHIGDLRSLVCEEVRAVRRGR